MIGTGTEILICLSCPLYPLLSPFAFSVSYFLTCSCYLLFHSWPCSYSSFCSSSSSYYCSSSHHWCSSSCLCSSSYLCSSFCWCFFFCLCSSCLSCQRNLGALEKGSSVPCSCSYMKDSSSCRHSCSCSSSLPGSFPSLGSSTCSALCLRHVLQNHFFLLCSSRP